MKRSLSSGPGSPGLWLVGLSLLTPALFADDGKINVQLAPSPVGVGELTELIIEASGEDLLSVPLEPSFELNNLEVAGGPSRRQNMSWNNGQVTRTSGLSWYLRALAEGEGRVTDITVRAGDRELSFPDEVVRITAEPQQRNRAGRGDSFGGLLDDFFRPRRPPPGPAVRPDIRLEAEISNRTPYAGEQILYTLYLLVESRPDGRAQFESIYPRQIPSFEGFWSQEIELPSDVPPDSVTRGEKTYWRQPTLRRALFPYNPGAQTIEPAELDLRTVFVQMTRFGPASRSRADVPVKSGTVHLDVKALPPAPQDFSGAVGQFRLQAALAPEVIESDEAATLSLSLQGSGQIQGIADPLVSPPVGLRVFPPQSRSSSRVRRNRVTNERSWEYTLVPEVAGDFEVPTVSFVYFDPAKGSYETLASPTSPLLVKPDSTAALLPATAASSESPPSAAESQAVASDVTEAGSEVLGAAGLRPPTERNITLLVVVATLGLVGVLAIWFQRRGQPGAKRQLLQRLKRACTDSSPRAAAAAAEDAWRDFLRDRFEVPVSQPCSQWPRSLSDAGVQPTLAEDLVQLMDDLHYLRYAPQLATCDTVQEEFWQRSRQLIRRLPT